MKSALTSKHPAAENWLVNPVCFVSVFCQVGWWSHAPTSLSAARPTARATELRASEFTAATAMTATRAAWPPVCRVSTTCCSSCPSCSTASSNSHHIIAGEGPSAIPKFDSHAVPITVNSAHSGFWPMNGRREGVPAWNLGCTGRLQDVWLLYPSRCVFQWILPRDASLASDIKRGRDAVWVHLFQQNNRDIFHCIFWLVLPFFFSKHHSHAFELERLESQQQMLLWLNMAPRVQPAGAPLHH